MRTMWRCVVGLTPWCAVALTLALLVLIELRWFPADTPTAPATTCRPMSAPIQQEGRAPAPAGRRAARRSLETSRRPR